MKDKPEVKKGGDAERGRVNARRQALKATLAAIAGLAAGHSVFKPLAVGETLAAGPVSVQIPRLSFAGQGAARQLSAQSRSQVLNSIAPALSSIVAQTGDRLPDGSLDALKQAILSRGQLNLPDPGAAAGWSITITVSSMPGGMQKGLPQKLR